MIQAMQYASNSIVEPCLTCFVGCRVPSKHHSQSRPRQSPPFIVPTLRLYIPKKHFSLDKWRRGDRTTRLLRTITAVAPLSPPTLPTAAATATATLAAEIVAFIRSSIDPNVLAATASASFKLFLICAAVGWLLKTNRIPKETAPVLSQISFQILIPCMLFSKVSTLLATQPNATLFAGMMVASITQLIIGAILGIVLSPLVDGRYSKNKTIFGWHPLDPSRPAAAIASATAAATGLPQATAALLPRPTPPPKGLRELIVVACTFGNSFTLPFVFFLSLLPPVLADRAVAYSGLFLLAWSPCLWSVGYAFIERGFAKSLSSSSEKEAKNSAHVDERIQKRVWSTGTTTTGGVMRVLRQAFNPPIVATVFGLAVGCLPIGKHLITALKGGAGAQNFPLELSLAWAALKSAYEVVELLAVGTLAMQTLVLASSLLQQVGGSGALSTSKQQPQGSFLKTAWKAITPSEPTEARALAVLAAVRFLLLPLCSLAVFQLVSSLDLVPAPLARDPIFLFVIAVQSVMPSAQNIIIMLQLTDSTRPAAPAFAKMLLKLYAYAILPVTLWVTAFASRLAIPLGM